MRSQRVVPEVRVDRSKLRRFVQTFATQVFQALYSSKNVGSLTGNSSRSGTGASRLPLNSKGRHVAMGVGIKQEGERSRGRGGRSR